MRQLRRVRLYEIISLSSFTVAILLSVVFTILGLPRITLVLLLVSFPISLITAIYGSLAIRQEEEEKS